ncbi:ExbD/TolR family protein [Hydrogenophaga sp.]|uniref:ExbD/TolR family protein n=1 Tax=Hydrogenophaga sp. TaxID=1904254 RepID=UPI002FC5968F
MSFGRLEKPVGHKPMSEINVTPLVDVMLVLLVIFIIAAPFMADRLALELPKAELPKAATPTEPGPFVSLSVDGQGRMQWDGQAVDDAALRQRLLEAAQRNPATELQLRADASVSYGRVVSLIGMAQSAGLARIGFVAESTAPR